MKFITPYSVTSSNLTASNVPENDHPVWNAATAYVVDNRVIYQNNIYTRLIAGTSPDAPNVDTTRWKFVSATNRYKMFDSKGGSQTVQANNIIVTINCTSVINSVALLLLAASSVRIKMTHPVEGVVYDKTTSFTSIVDDWYKWWFDPVTKQEVFIASDLPSYSGVSLEITITNTGFDAKCGSCILGRLVQYGGVQYGASVGIQDYSVKTKDSFGNISITPRSYTDRARFNIRLLSNQTDGLKQKLTSLRSVPVVYIGSEDFQSTVIYGFYKDFDIVLTSFPYSDCSIEIEGLV